MVLARETTEFSFNFSRRKMCTVLNGGGRSKPRFSSAFRRCTNTDWSAKLRVSPYETVTCAHLLNIDVLCTLHLLLAPLDCLLFILIVRI